MSDEGPVEEALFLIGRDAKGWTTRALKATANARTDDCEALARRGGWIYVVGSHFGKKEGPLEVERHFVARFREADAAKGPVVIEVAGPGFAIHRAINDALKTTTLVPRAPAEDRYLRGVAAARPGDRPLNIEGATFLESGALLLGLRFPVGPVLVELSNPDGLFRGEAPRIGRVRTLPAEGLCGVRALRRRGDELHVVTGNLDSKKRSAILEAHPAGADARSVHVVVPRKGAPRVVRRFDVDDVEGLAFGPGGRPVYVRDDKRVLLATIRDDE